MVIRIQVPGTLVYRDLAVRAVSSACKLVATEATNPGQFTDHVVSAFGEAYNNAALHSYGGQSAGDVEIEIVLEPEAMTIRVRDYGKSFDLSAVPAPDLDALPESGMGLFIIRSFMDDVTYESGAPNVLSMTKRLRGEGGRP